VNDEQVKRLQKMDGQGVECPKCGNYFTTKVTPYAPSQGSKAAGRTSHYPKLSCKAPTTVLGNPFPCLACPYCNKEALDSGTVARS